ncbi:thioredoxin family protein [Cryobacterium cryoconiti]|uniref:Thioredoxin n=1 Tax=Cryobacterium cryoconiti TaxID=1259239 RepID=A0A4Y8JY34_9MICO|nr:thioredoxin family protein [Cryobacterium cryoconiti]TFD32986.1 thioredoxin [Cryobacterium cryoconiti]
MNMHRSAAALALTVAVVVGVSGCASSTAGTQVESQADNPAGTSASPATPAAGEAPTPATAAGAYIDYSDGIIAKTEGTKVLFFHASWCPNCRALEKDINAGPLPAGLTIIKVDFDNAVDLRQQYGVTLQTTVVYVDDDGSELGKTILAEDPSVDALVAAAP